MILSKRFRLIDNRYQFSEQFMNSNKFYMSKLVSEGRSPSLSCVSNILQNLNMLKYLPNIDKTIIGKIDGLINEGQELINQKLLR